MRKTILPLVMAALLLAVPAGPASAEGAVSSPYGVQAVGLRLSAAAYMLDLRLLIVDAAAVEPLLRRKVTAVLRDPDGGKGRVLVVPFAAKIGSLAQTTRHPREGRVLAALFANPGRSVQPGETLELVIGDAVVATLEVEG